MSIVGGFDVHRRQITFDCLETATGEMRHGRIEPADRFALRAWLAELGGVGGEFALEGCTGWRYIVEELAAAGFRAHVAEPADTAALRGNKRRAKTDRADAKLLREHLILGDLPESWIPPHNVLEARSLIRLYKDLADQRVGWTQRLHATLFHNGVPAIASALTTEAGRSHVASCELSPEARRAADVALDQIDRANEALAPIKREISRIAGREPGCLVLRTHFGIGPIISLAIWAEMGDTRRFSSSSDAVRHAGLDITVYSSDTNRAKGHLARQGPGVLRWALFEAAMAASKPASPDHAYFSALRARLGTQQAAVAVARKLARWCHHQLRALGDDAYPVAA